MEVVPMSLPRSSSPSSAVGLPFNKRNVEEWSRLDRLTGIMEKAKIETDQWAARSVNAAHNYGKVVDSRERNNQDGSLQERQRKQMEVFQTKVPGGTMQVIRTQTITTSSKKWSCRGERVLGDLELPVNSLDLSCEKTKGSVGRSGSIGGRRPPTRPRSLMGQSSSGEESSVAKVCERLHEEAKREMLKGLYCLGDGGGGFGEGEGEGEVRESGKGSLSRQKSCSNEDLAGGEASLRRSSKVRRSLQLQRQSEGESGEELEWSARKSLKERAAEIEKLLRHGRSLGCGGAERGGEGPGRGRAPRARESFVSAETLKEVRERLRKPSSSDSEMKDDGIVTEKEEGSLSSKVKWFVNGMEGMVNGGGKKGSVNGTGSLESRSSGAGRTSEWYRRRKSYGFEQVEEPEKLKSRKQQFDSSTDSGICHSSETVGVPSWGKGVEGPWGPLEGSKGALSTVVTVKGRNGLGGSETSSVLEKGVNSVYVGSGGEGLGEGGGASESVWRRKSPIPGQKGSEAQESLKSSLRSAKNPWISQLRGTKLVDRNWASDEQEDSEEGRRQSDNSDKQSPPREDGGKSDSDVVNQKKSKKVEFCKTEVHFAAESGKFNIVETDGKPPPNDIFRRRRRSPGAPKNPNGLPETKFGDASLDKRLLPTADSISDRIEAELNELNRIVIEALPPPHQPNGPPKTPFAPSRLYDLAEEPPHTALPDTPPPRSILKNHPKPFLFPQPPSPPVWRSTVILRNKRFHDPDKKLCASDGETELQIRIRNLRKTDPPHKHLPPNPPTPPDPSKRRSLPDDTLLNHSLHSPPPDTPPLSVADRVKQVEHLSANNYSTKINFRSGHMTVVQNGTAPRGEEKTFTTWATHRRPPPKDDSTPLTGTALSCDKASSSNPAVMRLATRDDKTDPQKYQTTRILINLESGRKGEAAEGQRGGGCGRYGSWSSGAGREAGRCLEELRSSWVVRGAAPPREDIPRPSKTVHEIVDQFDSLSVPNRTAKDRRRKTVPIAYKPPKEYTHSDLEEELKNFTENLDKDFRDIYEEEIGSLRRARARGRGAGSPPKAVRPVLQVGSHCSGRSSSDEGSKRSSQRTSSRDNYDTDDSDLLADEEVRSYMSAGHGGTDSDTEAAYLSSSSRKSFEDSILRFRKLESQMKRSKEIRNNVAPVQTTYADPLLTRKPPGAPGDPPGQSKVASIALKYEDDPLFPDPPSRTLPTTSRSRNSNTSSNDTWERTSNSSSNLSGRPRERVSYLNGLSLSEKYSKYLQRSSTSSLDTMSELPPEKGRTRAEPPPPPREDNPLKAKSDGEGRHYKSKYSGRHLHVASSHVASSHVASSHVPSSSVPSSNVLSSHVPSSHVPSSHVASGRVASSRVASDRVVSSHVGSSHVASSRVGRTEERAVKEEARASRSSAESCRRRAAAERLSGGKKAPEGKEREETDSVILEELKRAADEILMAVNGYTDESSHVGSSEEEERGRRILRKARVGNLGTISEGKRVTKTELRRSVSASAGRRAGGNQSSASSLESLTKEAVRTPAREAKPARHRHGDGKPLSSRATRLLQRASSREALMPQPSSSEDIPSYLEQAKKRVVRRQRSSTSLKPDAAHDAKASAPRSKSRSKTTDSSTSRTRDRKTERPKESTTTTRTSRSTRTPDGERTKPTARRPATDKCEVEATRRRRSYHASKEEPATTQILRRKATAARKPEAQRTSQPT